MAIRIRSERTWSIVWSALMIFAGVVAIALPQVAGVGITAFVGWLLVFSGALHVAFAWRSGSTSHVALEVLLGTAYGVVGFYLLARPVSGLASLTLALGAYLTVEAILEIILWFQLRHAPGAVWLLVHGFITVVLAAMILSTWPWSAAWAIGTLVGFSMLFSGMARLMLSLALRPLEA
jgi:uncharacterized membrane protein HdeD (DUF308 family)